MAEKIGLRVFYCLC